MVRDVECDFDIIFGLRREMECIALRLSGIHCADGVADIRGEDELWHVSFDIVRIDSGLIGLGRDICSILLLAYCH